MSSGLAIVGYGKMGRLIEQLAPEYGFDVRAKFSRENNLHDSGISQESLRGIDVAVEFTTPDSAPDNLRRLASLGINTVCGTTGWFEHLSAVHKAIPSAGTGLVYSANFSVGVNVFLSVVREAAKLLADEKEYGAWAWEIHHDTKKDAPSGTMIKLVEEMKSAGYPRNIDVSSSRAGRHPGTHEIGFDSAADTITLRHAARSREGFARGALKAAQWIVGKQGVFEFSDVLFSKR